MKQSRRNHSSKFKSRVALEALRCKHIPDRYESLVRYLGW